MPKKSRVCVLASGGIDSALLIQEALNQQREIYPLYVAFDFQWEPSELEILHRLLNRLRSTLLQPLRVFPIAYREFFPDHWGFHFQKVPDRHAPDTDVGIPGRNFLLFSQAAVYAHAQELSEIWIGSLKGNPYADADPVFFEQMENLTAQSLGRIIKIRAPFRNLAKWEIMSQFPDFPYSLTVTCLRPNGVLHCGNCNKCEERKKHFQKARLTDPTSYQFIP